MMSHTKTENSSMNNHEISYCNFIKQRIESSGGSIKFQHLTGHLSQLSLDVRKSVGGGTQELMKFLRKHQNIFTIDPKGSVSIKQAASHLFASVDDDEREISKSNLPLSIEDGYGVVISLHPTFGFINAKHPFKTTIYFSPHNFKDGKGTLLTDHGLFMGCRLYFNATLGNNNFEAKYKATRVWKPTEPEDPPDEPIVQKSRKNRDTGLYDPNVKEGEGVVHKVFPTHAFITVEDDPSSSVFFHKNRLTKFSNVIDLTEIVQVGTAVEFSAMRSTKADTKARWEATKVWIKGNKSKKKINKSEEKNLSDDDDSVYDYRSVSSSNSLPGKKENHIEIFNSLIQNKTKHKSSKLLENESGKFYPRASGSVIKFGPKLSELADADSALFYVHGAKVVDKVWEFNDGDSVKFDAVRIKSAPGWKAVLGWVGDKPNVVISTEDFGISDDEISEASDVQAPNVPHKVQKKEWTNSNYKMGKSKSSPKPLHKSSKSSLDLESEQDSGIYLHPKNKKSKESYMSLTDLEKEMCKNKQSSRASSLSSLNSSKGSLKNYKKSKQYEDSKILVNKNANDTKNGNANFTSVRKSKYNWAEVTSSGDEQDSEFSMPKVGSKPRTTVDISEELNENEQNGSNLEMTNIAAKFANLLAISDDDNEYDDEENFENYNDEVDFENDDEEKFENGINEVESENDNHEVEFERNNDEVENENVDYEMQNAKNNSCEAVTLSNEAVSEVSNKNLKPYVKFFEGILGTVCMAYSRFIMIESKALQDTAVCGFTDIYQNGTPISDHFDDVREVIKSEDSLKFNCFEVLDNSDHYWQVVTMAWKGSKPKIKQITVKEFLESRPDISVTIDDEPQKELACETSSKSMVLFNKEKEVNRSQKYLAVVNSNIENEETDSKFEASNFLRKQQSNNHKEDNSSPENKKFLTELQQSDNHKEITSSPENKKFLTELQQSREECVTHSSTCKILAARISRMLIEEDIINKDAIQNIHNISLQIVDLITKEMKDNGETKKSSSSIDKNFQADISLASLDVASQTNNCKSSSSSRSSSSSNQTVQTIITGEIFSQSIFTQ